MQFRGVVGKDTWGLPFCFLLILAVPIYEIHTKKCEQKHYNLAEKRQLDAIRTLGPTHWVHPRFPLHKQMRSRHVSGTK